MLILDVHLMALGDGMIFCGKRSAFYSQTAINLTAAVPGWTWGCLDVHIGRIINQTVMHCCTQRGGCGSFTLIFLNFMTNTLLGRPPIDTTIGTWGELWPWGSNVPDRCFIVGMLACLLLIMHGFATWVPHQLYCRMVYFCKVLVVSKAKVTHNLRLNSYNKLNTSPD